MTWSKILSWTLPPCLVTHREIHSTPPGATKLYASSLVERLKRTFTVPISSTPLGWPNRRADAANLTVHKDSYLGTQCRRAAAAHRWRCRTDAAPPPA